MKSAERHILFVSHDPGGSNAIIPVAKRMERDVSCVPVVYASAYAVPLWEESGLRHETLDPEVSENEIAMLIEERRPCALITGTSEKAQIENRFWRVTRERDIASFAVIDHWSNYLKRFVRNGIADFPDYIYTMDALAEEEMISEGVPASRIVVSGQPLFEEYARYRSRRTLEQFCISNRLPVKKIICFVSDTVAASFGVTGDGAPRLGYDEETTLQALFGSLKSSELDSDEYQVIIKLHPKEPEDRYDALLGSRLFNGFDVSVLKQTDNKDLLFHSTIVAGMFSMLLFEAYLMGRPALFIQLNSNRQQKFGSFEVDIVDRQDKLDDSVRRLLATADQCTPPVYSMRPAKFIVDHVLRSLATG